MTQHTAHRNPRGLASDKPIALRLMPDERRDALRISKVKGLSSSAFARQCYLAGKELLYPSSPSASSSQPRKRRSRGGNGSPAPAAISSVS